MFPVILERIPLFLEDVASPEPRPGPWLIGPRQADGEVGLARVQHLFEGPAEEPLAAEPVVPVAEALDPVAAG